MVNNAIFVILPVKGMAKKCCFPNELNADFFLSSLAPRAIDKHMVRHIQQNIEISNIPSVKGFTEVNKYT